MNGSSCDLKLHSWTIYVSTCLRKQLLKPFPNSWTGRALKWWLYHKSSFFPPQVPLLCCFGKRHQWIMADHGWMVARRSHNWASHGTSGRCCLLLACWRNSRSQTLGTSDGCCGHMTCALVSAPWLLRPVRRCLWPWWWFVTRPVTPRAAAYPGKLFGGFPTWPCGGLCCYRWSYFL